MQVKERFFEPLAAQRGLVSDSPGGGRKVLGEEASHHVSTPSAKNVPRISTPLLRRLEPPSNERNEVNMAQRATLKPWHEVVDCGTT